MQWEWMEQNRSVPVNHQFICSQSTGESRSREVGGPGAPERPFRDLCSAALILRQTTYILEIKKQGNLPQLAHSLPSLSGLECLSYVETGSSVPVQQHFGNSLVALPQVPVPFPLPAHSPSFAAITAATSLRPGLIGKGFEGQEVTAHC